MKLPLVTVSCAGRELPVIDLEIEDGINRIMTIRAVAVFEKAPLELEFIGKPATLTIEPEHYRRQTYTGIVTRERSTVTDHAQNAIYESLVEVTIRSSLFMLTRTMACSVLGVPRAMAVQDFVRFLLDRKNVVSDAVPWTLPMFPDDVEFALEKTHPGIENAVQFNKTNYDFLVDTLGQMGIFFFYKPLERARPGGVGTLVVTDTNTPFEVNEEELRFLTTEDRDPNRGYLYEVSHKRDITFDTFEVFSRNSETDVSENDTIEETFNRTYPRQMYLHGIDEAQAKYLIDIYKRYLHHQARGITAVCDRPDVRVGQIVTTVDRNGTHRLKSLVVGSRIKFLRRGEEQTLRCELTLRSTRLAYADTDPMRTMAHADHQAPAIVEGTSDRAYLDDKGRYQLKYNIDRTSTAIGTGSAPTSSHLKTANTNYTDHYPLPPGTEVLVSYPETIFSRPYIASRFDSYDKASPLASDNDYEHLFRTVGGLTMKVVDGPSIGGGANETMISFEARMTVDSTAGQSAYLRLGTPKYDTGKTEQRFAASASGTSLAEAAAYVGEDIADLRGVYAYSAQGHYVLVDQNYLLSVCGSVVERILGERYSLVTGDNVVITRFDT